MKTSPTEPCRGHLGALRHDLIILHTMKNITDVLLLIQEINLWLVYYDMTEGAKVFAGLCY